MTRCEGDKIKLGDQRRLGPLYKRKKGGMRRTEVKSDQKRGNHCISGAPNRKEGVGRVGTRQETNRATLVNLRNRKGKRRSPEENDTSRRKWGISGFMEELLKSRSGRQEIGELQRVLSELPRKKLRSESRAPPAREREGKITRGCNLDKIIRSVTHSGEPGQDCQISVSGSRRGQNEELTQEKRSFSKRRNHNSEPFGNYKKTRKSWSMISIKGKKQLLPSESDFTGLWHT